MTLRWIAALLAGAALVAGAFFVLGAEDPSRQQEVATRGAQVMPFSLDATTHVFDARPWGGTQSVVANDPEDIRQIELVRDHLADEARAFRSGDFSDPATIHGDAMPGLEVLEAGFDDMIVRYRPLPDGGKITYQTDRPSLAAALAAWFDAQLGDHGDDAVAASRRTAAHNSHTNHEG